MSEARREKARRLLESGEFNDISPARERALRAIGEASTTTLGERPSFASKEGLAQVDPEPNTELTTDDKREMLKRIGWEPEPAKTGLDAIALGYRKWKENLTTVEDQAERDFDESFPGMFRREQMQPVMDQIDVHEASRWLALAERATTPAPGMAALNEKMKMGRERMNLAKLFAGRVKDPERARELLGRLKDLDDKEFEKQRSSLFGINLLSAADVIGNVGRTVGLIEPDSPELSADLAREAKERGLLGNLAVAGAGFAVMSPHMKVLQSGLNKGMRAMKMSEQMAGKLSGATALGVWSASQGGNAGEGFAFGLLTPPAAKAVSDVLAKAKFPLRAQAALGEGLAFVGVGAGIHGFDVDQALVDGILGAATGGVRGKQGLILRRAKQAHEEYQAAKTEFERERASKAVNEAVGELREPVAPTAPTPGSRTSAEAGFLGLSAKEMSSTESLAKEVSLRGGRKVRAMSGETAHKVKQWEKSLGKGAAQKMEDVGALVEKGGNVRTGESYDQVLARSTPEVRAVAAKVAKRFEALRQELNKIAAPTTDGDYLAQVPDYLSHFYVGTKAEMKAVTSRLMKNSPNAKKRRFPTLEEAKAAGLTPRTQNAGEILNIYTKLNAQVVMNREMIHRLNEGGIVASSSERPSAEHVLYEGRGAAAISRMRILGKTKSGDLMVGEGPVWVHKEALPYVKAMVEKPWNNKFTSAVQAVNAFAKSSQLSFSLFHDVTLRGSANASLSTFLDFRHGAKALNPLRGIVRLFEIDPATGKFMLATTPGAAGKRLRNMGLKADNDSFAAQKDMIEHGITLEAASDARISHIDKMYDALNRKFGKVPILGKTIAGIDSLRKIRQRMLWGYHSNVKAIAYHDMVQRFIGNADPADHSKLKQAVAGFVNDAFGGQEWMNTLLKHPKVKQAVHMAVFAPDWTISNVKVALPGLFNSANVIRKSGGGKFNVRERLWSSYWRNSLTTYAIGSTGMQTAIFHAFGDESKGDKAFPWENEEGRQHLPDVTPLYRKIAEAFPGLLSSDTEQSLRDGRRQYVRLGKQMFEPIRYISEPDRMLFNKSAPLVRQAMAQLTGSEGRGWILDFAKEEQRTGDFQLFMRIKHAARDALPFAFRGGQFMLSLPASKGESQFRSEMKMGVAIDDWARGKSSPINEGLRHILRKARKDRTMKAGESVRRTLAQISANELGEMIADYADTIQRNGGDPAKAIRNALGSVRGTNMKALIAAVRANDKTAMEEEAAVFMKLKGTAARLRRSLRARQGVSLSKEEYERLDEAIRKTGPADD